ncbi:lysophospholipid acyltransferase family protein [Neptunicoccus cionae]|uniref:lysophospholipid acyltransferase family protein n=1 Tax=Neptunicoccus cionae TaxID=2035344 RepID=UPI000C776085|nr:lysophospholipid acyltransferase family protein [Amylibacter cionae]PLS21786.1 acyltransferase [Amylibacter cionae]
MTEKQSVILEATGGTEPYKASELTYAGSFDSPFKRILIQIIENLTGRLKLLWLVRQWERDENRDPDFWKSVLDRLDIKLTTPKEQLDYIPKEGPLVVVSNHPHGLVDGIVMAHLLSHARDDYKILARAFLRHVPRIDKYLLPVAFPHEPDAIQTNIRMRKEAISHLKEGGCIALFPAGTVATSETWFGPVVDPEWMPFTAKMIRQSGAQVLPVFFPGANSRAYQIANKLSVTLRQSLLLHEIKHAMHKDQAVVVGELISPEDLKSFEKDGPGLMKFLKQKTYDLKPA